MHSAIGATLIGGGGLAALVIAFGIWNKIKGEGEDTWSDYLETEDLP